MPEVPLLSDPADLAKVGILKLPLPPNIDWLSWARRLSQPTLDNFAFEADGEYAFYRNIMEETDFPFTDIPNSIDPQLLGLSSWHELRLDDAFCVHYHQDQEDTSGAKHTDPSDVTINMCLEKTPETVGSHVLFYGQRSFPSHHNNGTQPKEDNFCVVQEPGYMTIHAGDHAHETLPLEKGQRTNIILTYWFRDKSKSGAASRTCYFPS